METEIRNLVKLRGENFIIKNYALSNTDFNYIGTVDSFQDLEEFPSGLLFIWHVSDGITNLNNSEIERWSVDAPIGNHLIISERYVDAKIKKNKYTKGKIFVWGPDELSTWFGNAILNKDLKFSFIEKNHKNDIIEIKKSQEVIPSILTLKPNIDISSWIFNNKMPEMTYTPVLLNSRLWEISGELIGPSGTVEKKKWHIIEDPWEDNFFMLANADILSYTPSLRIIEPNTNHWKEKSQVVNLIKPLIDEKRQGKPKNAGSFTQSIVLQNWNFKSNNCHLQYKKIFIPAWFLHTKDKQIIHGISGKKLSI
jgi:hypothetical protein